MVGITKPAKCTVYKVPQSAQKKCKFSLSALSLQKMLIKLENCCYSKWKRKPSFQKLSIEEEEFEGKLESNLAMGL